MIQITTSARNPRAATRNNPVEFVEAPSVSGSTETESDVVAGDSVGSGVGDELEVVEEEEEEVEVVW